MTQVVAMVTESRVRPVIGSVRPLDAASDALTDVAAGNLTCRAVLDVTGDT